MKHVKLHNKQALIDALNNVLANEYVIYTKTLKYHWNVEGVHFFGLHKLFDEQYHDLLAMIDELAERVRALKGIALGTLSEFLKATILKEKPGHNPNEQGMIKDLYNDHEIIINHIRPVAQLASELHDEGTVNFLGELLEKHEKMAWMLKAHLTRSSEK